MCIPLSLFQNPYEVGNLYKSLSINPKMNICKFELFCPACSQFFFNCKNRWLSLFIVHARGRDVKSQGEEETKGEWRGEMDRGEDRDLLSSAVFDGSHDRLHNKRLMANDSKRKRDGKRWRRGRGGGGFTSIQALSAVQVSCSGGTTRQQDCLSSGAPDTQFHQQESQCETWRDDLNAPILLPKSQTLTGRHLYKSASPCRSDKSVSDLCLAICHHCNVMNHSCLFRQYTDFITRKHKPTITNTTNKKINLKYIHRSKCFCINLTLLHYSVLVSVILLHDLLTFDLPAQKNWRCFSAELYLSV